MKLLNHTLIYLSVALLIILSIWAVIFYFKMLEEINKSIDDGLENNKILIIQNARIDSAILDNAQFKESNYLLEKTSSAEALSMTDSYKDTLIFVPTEEDYQPVRLLTSAFIAENGDFYKIKLISSIVEEDDLIEELLYSLLWLYIAMLGSILIVNNLILKKVWKPFYDLLNQIKSFTLGNESLFTPSKTRVNEFKVLNETILSMLRRNLEVYTSQKQFIENAAHELQTPLAISVNKLELLAENSNLTEDDYQKIGEVIQTIGRLSRLNKSLLLLSKIENKQFIIEEVLDIKEVIEKVVEEFSDLLQFKELTLKVIFEGSFTYKVNRELIEILISNLLKNAITYNVPQGDIEIRVDYTSFSIKNTGVETPLDTTLMFNRFYKGGTEKNATGLGLAIVKAIVDLYQLTLTYSYANNHTFLVKFK